MSAGCCTNWLAEWLTYSVIGLEKGTRLGEAACFFLYEVPKVLLLLAAVVFAVGIVRSFFTPERTRRLLAGRNEFGGNVLASLLGVTFSFLVASPMINEVALVLLFGLFGWKVAALYAGTGLLIAIFAGWTIGRLKLEKWVEPWVYASQAAAVTAGAEERLSWPARLRCGGRAVKEIVGKVWIYVVLGIAVGAGIHGYVPQDAMASIMGRGAWWSVPAAVLLGVPMYSNAAGIIPVVQALLGKGAALGTVLAFMMAVIGLSLPEAVILRKVLTLRLLAVFFGIVSAGIMLVGFLFNALFS
jgi:uncharacterized membrane protein YraQ (UPF0718 family)